MKGRRSTRPKNRQSHAHRALVNIYIAVLELSRIQLNTFKPQQSYPSCTTLWKAARPPGVFSNCKVSFSSATGKTLTWVA